MDERENIFNIIFALGLVMGFVFLVSFTVFYVKEKFSITKACECPVSLTTIIISLTSLGVFVGTIVYYFIAKAYTRKSISLKKNALETLNFLDNEGKAIVKCLIDNKGSLTQSKLAKLTSIPPVKLSRRLKKLEEKGIVLKEKRGMSNVVVLSKNLIEFFLK